MARFLAVVSLGLLVGCMGIPESGSREVRAPGSRPPNVVIFLTDDQGYGDLSSYGHPTISTPHVDGLAAGGVKLTQFYVASPVCTPSRAGLLTGCYPKRVGLHRHVIFPEDDHGLHPDEVTLAEILRERGYATGCFGKWHLGHRRGLLPLDQGFDVYFGVPYSNDMAQFHRPAGHPYPNRLPLLDGSRVIEWEPDQRLLTKRCTDRVLSFIDAHAGDPFFAYVPFSMPHIPIYASEAYVGTSPRGLYGDVIEEIDASVGQVMARLEHHGLVEDTLVIFLSDNGPWLPFKEKGGSAGLLRGGKGSNWEGGQRVPCVLQWPRVLPAGVVRRQLTTALDLLPTIAFWTGARLPTAPIDGVDLARVFTSETSTPRADFVYYSSKGQLAGIRRGPWKLLLEPEALYQVEKDPREKWDRAGDHPERVEELRRLATRRDAGISAGARPVLRVEERVFDPRK